MEKKKQTGFLPSKGNLIKMFFYVIGAGIAFRPPRPVAWNTKQVPTPSPPYTAYHPIEDKIRNSGIKFLAQEKERTGRKHMFLSKFTFTIWFMGQAFYLLACLKPGQ
jgi:hypothetical protein